MRREAFIFAIDHPRCVRASLNDASPKGAESIAGVWEPNLAVTDGRQCWQKSTSLSETENETYSTRELLVVKDHAQEATMDGQSAVIIVDKVIIPELAADLQRLFQRCMRFTREQPSIEIDYHSAQKIYSSCFLL
jgi:hypothetical protein